MPMGLKLQGTIILPPVNISGIPRNVSKCSRPVQPPGVLSLTDERTPCTISRLMTRSMSREKTLSQ